MLGTTVILRVDKSPVLGKHAPSTLVEWDSVTGRATVQTLVNQYIVTRAEYSDTLQKDQTWCFKTDLLINNECQPASGGESVQAPSDTQSDSSVMVGASDHDTGGVEGSPAP